jgi:methylphosphotriester-DNA--protein-cysteine methyltransferase
MVNCLDTTDVLEDSAARGRHQLIMRRFHRVVEENPDTALYIPELCAAIGVSQRTLYACCQEYLRMGPKRYLLLRRMNLARRELRKAVPSTSCRRWRLGWAGRDEPSRICHSSPKNKTSAFQAIGLNPTAVRLDPLDLKERISCRLTRLHLSNCRLSMNAN